MAPDLLRDRGLILLRSENGKEAGDRGYVDKVFKDWFKQLLTLAFSDAILPA